MRRYLLLLIPLFGALAAAMLWALTDPALVRSAPPDTASAAPTAAVDEVYVPAGPYARGCSADTSPVRCDLDARPINLVHVDAFYIDRMEVSNADYAACVAAGACPPPLAVSSNTRDDYTTNPAYANYPVVQVDWGRAAAYCSWRGQRLPTEAEWEKAARGTDRRWFPWGNEIPDCSMANIAHLDNSPCFGDTTPVDAYPEGASPYGAINMAGNVREWVSDLYESRAYITAPYYNPQGPERTDKGEHLVRGGSWADHIDGASNTWARTDEKGIYHMEAIGFRCARTALDMPVPTPMPTPIPTPPPSDTGRIGPEGGMLWVTHPGHLTALHVPSGSLASEIAVSLTYTEPRSAGENHALDHFFTLGGDPLTEPAALLLGFDTLAGIVPDTAELYRLDGSTWVTGNITLTERSTGHMLAWITQPGTYGVLGQTNRIYLPVTLHH